MPKLSFAAALPVGTESLHETLEVQCHGSGPDPALRARIGGQLPSGLEIRSLDVLNRDAGSLRNREIHYEIFFDGVKAATENLETFLASDSFPVTKRGKKGDREIDARAQVVSAHFSSPSTMRLALRVMDGPALKPLEIVQRVFCLGEEDLESIGVLKVMEITDSRGSEGWSERWPAS
jgi:radical SAM-linked protein